MTVETKEKIDGQGLIVGVLGPIGVGKSTLSEPLSQSLGFAHIEENFPENPFLKKFYDDPVNWSFKSQVWFLQQKVAQLESLDPHKNYLIDPALEMDRLYAKTLMKIGFMNSDEYLLYSDMFETLVVEKQIRKPDLYIRMGAGLSVVRSRIIKRGRAFEMKMLREYPHYLSELNGSVRDFATSQTGINIIYVNADMNSFLDAANIKSLASSVEKKLHE